jgi:hypothetical protein
VTEDLYVRRLLAAYRELPDASGRVRAADRRLAVRLFHDHVPLELVTAAFQLALARRRARPPDLPPLGTIRSLHYFLPVLDEARTLDPDYLDYVVQRALHGSTPPRGGCQPR